MVYLTNIFWHGVCMNHRHFSLFCYCEQPESKISPLVPSDPSHILNKGRWAWPSWVTSLQMELLNFGNLLTPNSALKSWMILSHFLLKLVTVSQWGNRVWQSFALASFILLEQRNKPRELLKGDETSQLRCYFSPKEWLKEQTWEICSTSFPFCAPPTHMYTQALATICAPPACSMCWRNTNWIIIRRPCLFLVLAAHAGAFLLSTDMFILLFQ